MSSKVKREKIRKVTHYRKLELERATADDDSRSIDASLSSELPVRQVFGTEILLHDTDNVNLERAGENGLPLLLGHDGRQLIGRAREVRLDGERLRARLDFSQNTELARSAWADIRDRFLTDISIGYEIEDFDEIERDGETVIEVTRWLPFEASVVTVPADPTVGINRKKGEKAMPKPKDEQTKAGELSVTDFQAAREKSKREGIADGAKQENERVREINKIFARHIHRDGVEELRDTCLEDSKITVTRASNALLEFLAGEPEPIAQPRRQDDGHHGTRTIETTADERDKWIDGVSRALMLRANLIDDAEEKAKARQNEFFGESLLGIARSYLVRQSADITRFNRREIAGQAFVRAGYHGTSDFANVLENVASKALGIGYTEQPETWRTWARVGNLTDFKVASRVNISSFSDLELVLESAEYKEGHLSDLKETIQLAKYGKLFHISREAIINDDLSAMTTIPRGMGRAAARQVGDLAYNILTSNPTLNQDGVALFDTATHNNNAGTPSAITEATVDAAATAMATQTSPAPGTGETGATLNIVPAFMMVPRAKLQEARKVMETPTAPDTSGDLAVNTVRNIAEIVWDARLDAASATAWYLAANPNLFDTIEVAFLDGDDSPFLESENGFTIDGVRYKVRIEAAAAALDYRGLYRNTGA